MPTPTERNAAAADARAAASLAENNLRDSGLFQRCLLYLEGMIRARIYLGFNLRTPAHRGALAFCRSFIAVTAQQRMYRTLPRHRAINGVAWLRAAKRISFISDIQRMRGVFCCLATTAARLRGCAYAFRCRARAAYAAGLAWRAPPRARRTLRFFVRMRGVAALAFARTAENACGINAYAPRAHRRAVLPPRVSCVYLPTS